MSTRLRQLPDASGVADPAARELLDGLKEVAELREGRRGDPLQRAVTVRDLLDLGVISLEQARAIGGRR